MRLLAMDMDFSPLDPLFISPLPPNLHKVLRTALGFFCASLVYCGILDMFVLLS